MAARLDAARAALATRFPMAAGRTGYTCASCSAPATLVEGTVVRTCACDVGVVAHMSAVAIGDSRMGQG